jgi:hypothetical protein
MAHAQYFEYNNTLNITATKYPPTRIKKEIFQKKKTQECQVVLEP